MFYSSRVQHNVFFFFFTDVYSLIGNYLTARKTNLWLDFTDHVQMNKTQKDKWVVLGTKKLFLYISKSTSGDRHKARGEEDIFLSG